MSHEYIPAEAHLFFPPPHSTKCTEVQRMVFDGNTVFNKDENEEITKFRTYCQKQNHTLHPMWTENMILRFLYANNFKGGKTLTSIKQHTVWRETCLPVQLDDPMLKIINSGLLYVHGRDHQFRPIVWFNLHMVDPKKTDVDLIIRVMTFWLEYVINEWMLPGQIETWKFVADMKGMGIATLALSSMRKLFSYLQENYKCRLDTLYTLNVTKAMYIPYQVVKKFLDDVTVQKIQFYQTGVPLSMFNTTNPEQVEQKYGGTAPNCTQFWPPVVPSTNYFISPNDANVLISKEKYTDLYRTGHFRNMKVNQTLVIQNTGGLFSPDKLRKAPMSAVVEPEEIGRLSARLAQSESVSPAFDIPRADQVLFNSFSGPQEVNYQIRSENVEDDEDCDTDYAHYMDENLSVKKINPVKNFKATFIESLRVSQ